MFTKSATRRSARAFNSRPIIIRLSGAPSWFDVACQDGLDAVDLPASPAHTKLANATVQQPPNLGPMWAISDIEAYDRRAVKTADVEALTPHRY